MNKSGQVARTAGLGEVVRWGAGFAFVSMLVLSLGACSATDEESAAAVSSAAPSEPALADSTEVGAGESAGESTTTIADASPVSGADDGSGKATVETVETAEPVETIVKPRPPLVFGTPPEHCGGFPWEEWDYTDGALGDADWLVLSAPPALEKPTSNEWRLDGSHYVAKFAMSDAAVSLNLFGSGRTPDVMLLNDEFDLFLSRAFDSGADQVVFGHRHVKDSVGYAKVVFPFAIKDGQVNFRGWSPKQLFSCNMFVDFDDAAKKLGLDTGEQTGFVSIIEELIAGNQTVSDSMTEPGAFAQATLGS